MTYIIVSIWHKLILICSLLNGIRAYSTNIMELAKQNNLTDQPLNISLYPENQGNITKIDNNIDYIIKLHFILNEQKIIPFLRDKILNEYEQLNITTKDLTDLFQLRDYDFKNILGLLDIPSELLSFSNFEEVLAISNLTFNQYYAEMKTNISGQQLQEILKILEINPMTFSGTMAFGTEEEIHQVLNNGSYSWKKFDEIENNTAIDVPELTKNIILNRLLNKSIQELVEDIQKIPMINEDMYRNVWRKINISTYDIYKVENLRRILDNIHEHLIENITFGVTISEHEILAHKSILENLNTMKEIVNVYGETSTSHRIYDNLRLTNGLTENTARLWSNNSLPSKIEIFTKKPNESSLNCSYFDNDLSEHNVTLMNIKQTNITVVVDDDVNFNIGNPLVCDDKLLGLAQKQIEEEGIFVFDTFFKTVEIVSDDSVPLTLSCSIVLFSVLINFFVI